MTVCEAPGKVYLFGEHAVVYGEPAVPAAIERRATVTAEPREDDHVRVEAEDLSLNGFTVEYAGGTSDRPDVDVPTPLVEAAMGYVDAAVEQAREAADAPDAGFDITVESDIPLGAGLGSSAAVVVAGIDAATRALGEPLDRRELAERAYRAEFEVQDGQASRADTFCSTMGGAVRVEGDDCEPIDAPNLPFVVGFDGGAGDTGELVAGVRELRAEHEFAADTVESIGDLVRTGEELLADADPESDPDPALLAELGELMDFNHGLLAALGVSARSLDAMVWAARDAGAHGAKLTGAGGGGCIVALDESDATETALSFTQGCEESFRAELATEGVRVVEP
ncbi:mevalonate kinase [Halorubrum ezzemoulense]|jgi:mevalonate kinase|uniref:Mevalonate kinase n=1 Tax=Halorubrum ezzemoulense TaxID=337243 RepID=A0A256J4B2_HALEZ|nr:MULTISPECIES: mevalonate kinase [Halorubrum]MDB2223261.1 mevalonate kinase [Halorubrum ezzemoulense]MDB2237773.1 mevalonate kinase [Halorubrum ezzemoulense]MDB2240629.1 mevalonate kinase [Halorubrum ezzemoulense]MDB2243494.1 mevalonate kinase [Halorubrum ezzemoulense]MDB2248733.1 mevalonate kinase [Halorubrum ezzemoulense]